MLCPRWSLTSSSGCKGKEPIHASSMRQEGGLLHACVCMGGFWACGRAGAGAPPWEATRARTSFSRVLTHGLYPDLYLDSQVAFFLTFP